MYVSLEMPVDDDLVSKALGAESEINFLGAEKYGFYVGDEKRAREVAAQIDKFPLKMVYRPRLTPRQLQLECWRAKQDLQKSLGLVVIDYLGLMQGNRPAKERFVEMSGVVTDLKALAGELRVPILSLAQINREGAKGGGEFTPPTLDQIRDTGTAEEHADNVIVLWAAKRTKRPALDRRGNNSA